MRSRSLACFICRSFSHSPSSTPLRLPASSIQMKSGGSGPSSHLTFHLRNPDKSLRRTEIPSCRQLPSVNRVSSLSNISSSGSSLATMCPNSLDMKTVRALNNQRTRLQGWLKDINEPVLRDTVNVDFRILAYEMPQIRPSSAVSRLRACLSLVAPR